MTSIRTILRASLNLTRRPARLAIACLVWIVLCPAALAGVNAKNGNFYISYTDSICDGIEIIRTYNSKSTQSGWFGYGWGSDYETFLTFWPDKSVTLHHNGAGAMDEFKFDITDESQITREVSLILAAIQKQSAHSENAVSETLPEQLTTERGRRQAYMRHYGLTLPSGEEIPVGASARAFRGSLVRTSQGFTYTNANNERHIFDLQGRLRRVGKAGEEVRIDYDDNGKPYALRTRTCEMKLYWDKVYGTVAFIDATGVENTAYKYRTNAGQTVLVESRDAENNFYQHDYDNRQNMTRIDYVNGESMQISYGEKTGFTEQVIGRTGDTSRYSYGGDDKNYFTEIRKGKTVDGKFVEEDYFREEFWIGSHPDGRLYTQKKLQQRDDFTTIVETGCTGRSLDRITVNGAVIAQWRFIGTPCGRRYEVTTPDETITVQLREFDNQVLSVRRRSRATGSTLANYEFNYMSGGRIDAVNASGQEALELMYEDDRSDVIGLRSGDRDVRLVSEDDQPPHLAGTDGREVSLQDVLGGLDPAARRLAEDAAALTARALTAQVDSSLFPPQHLARVTECLSCLVGDQFVEQPFQFGKFTGLDTPAAGSDLDFIKLSRLVWLFRPDLAKDKAVQKIYAAEADVLSSETTDSPDRTRRACELALIQDTADLAYEACQALPKSYGDDWTKTHDEGSSTEARLDFAKWLLAESHRRMAAGAVNVSAEDVALHACEAQRLVGQVQKPSAWAGVLTERVRALTREAGLTDAECQSRPIPDYQQTGTDPDTE